MYVSGIISIIGLPGSDRWCYFALHYLCCFMCLCCMCACLFLVKNNQKKAHRPSPESGLPGADPAVPRSRSPFGDLEWWLDPYRGGVTYARRVLQSSGKRKSDSGLPLQTVSERWLDPPYRGGVTYAGRVLVYGALA